MATNGTKVPRVVVWSDLNHQMAWKSFVAFQNAITASKLLCSAKNKIPIKKLVVLMTVSSMRYNY